MITRIQRSLAARRDALHQGDKGFTLIELLVVIIIIGILAAIAIPVYIGFQNSAKESATQTDVTNLKIAVVALQTNNGGSLPGELTPSVATLPTTPDDWPSAGATISPNTTSLTYKKVTGGGFCVSGVSSTGTIFKASNSTSVAKATTGC